MIGLVDTAVALLPRQTICNDSTEVRNVLARLHIAKSVCVVSFLNAHALTLACRNSAFREALMGSDFLFRDGVGTEIVMKRAGLAPGLNLNGTDLIPQILSLFMPNTPVALFGTRDPALSGAAAAMRNMGFKQVETLDGFQQIDTYIACLRQSTARVVLLGMGMPKQELVARAIASTPDLKERDMLIINGGAIIDFMSGQVTRAPVWMRRAKLEWAYRTIKEPKRLLPRIVSTLPLLAMAYMDGRQIRSRIERQ